MSLKPKICAHLSAITSYKKSKAHACEECIKTGDAWVHLRVCQSCGTTLCCDSSKNKHATKHAAESGHLVIASAKPGENWLWCYEDQLFIEY